MLCRLVLLCIGWLPLASVFAQDALQTPLTISFANEPVAQALTRLSAQAPVQLSFNPDVLPKKSISGQYEHQSLEHILRDLLGTQYQYKVRGSYVIILAAAPAQPKKRVQFTGEVRDAATGETLANTTVYEVDRLSATLSSEDGSFNLSASTARDVTVLAISKANYQDTLIQVDLSQPTFVEVALQPTPEAPAQTTSPTDRWGLVRFLVGEKVSATTENVSLSGKRGVQLSLIPGLSTNKLFNSKISNTFSLNMVGGYAYRLNGVELGGAFNLERMGVTGVQIGGAFNLSGAQTQGIQVAGAANVSVGPVEGVQIGGAYNQSDDVHGLQIGGAANLAKELDGIQVGGAVNVAHSGRGLQLAGAYNLARDSLRGAQVGTINYTPVLRGFQLGVINVADTVQTGAMLGLINWTKNGLLDLALEANDVTEIALTFRSGTPLLYTLLSAGISPRHALWTYGYGLGHQFRWSNRFYTHLELSSHTLFATSGPPIRQQPWDSRLFTSLAYQFAPRVSLHGGPVFHFLYHKSSTPEDFRLSDQVGTSPVFDTSSDGVVRKWWIGYQFALQFRLRR
ncbi:hypothetical protein SAMN05421823_104143 [Catalinimonas alkaloidigena]|uniref:CarboxypepD_reg-like domain-containing protein n=1 Tax=Catalinimonas alkaloidigena TaxID=1075417 RepID=A0A1G9GLX4_9BACT|nr:STN domain-containing protein [Catalinimonas alkaloidigena]SDL01273.1 hypothetical protein SAMN05421823_104143 [Catalinimonas alkaloidigena]